MKKIVYYICEGDGDDYFFERFKNSLLFSKKGTYYFSSKKTHKIEQIIVEIYFLHFNEDLVNNINKTILKKSLLIASGLSKEEILINKSQVNKLESGIQSTIYKFSELNQPKIIDFCFELFWKIITSHYLHNGNKRVGFAFLFAILWEFGFYFTWTSEFWINRSSKTGPHNKNLWGLFYVNKIILRNKI